MKAVIRKKTYANNANADATTMPSRPTARKRRDIGDVCKGISIPGRFGLGSSSSDSIRMPPKAGKGGVTSGTSRIRGKSCKGSASSSKGFGGADVERRKGMTRAVVSGGGQYAGASMPRGSSAVYSRGATWAAEPFKIRWDSPEKDEAVFVGSEGSNFNCNEGYRGWRGWRRAR